MGLSRTQKVVSWVLQLTVAVILFQTLFFKFTGAEESKYIFSTLLGDSEAVGRIGSGVIELIAGVLLLYPRTAWLGALLALGTISGAIFSHLTKLGVTLPAVGDRGELFALALAVFAGSAAVLFIRRRELPFAGALLSGDARRRIDASLRKRAGL
jgi:putative oxidoreductase